MVCRACGRVNAANSLFCQHCGQRLADATRRATPPAGIRSAEAVPTECPRCQADVAAGLRFCNQCGFSLGTTPPKASSTKPTHCWRCKASLEPGADFCKYCGAKAEAPSEQTIPQVETLVSVQKDGTDGKRFRLDAAQIDIGRAGCAIELEDDPYLSPRHARIVKRAGATVLIDLESVNGVFLRIREPVPLRNRDIILVGQQVLRLDILDPSEYPLGPGMQHGVLLFGTPEQNRWARLAQTTTEGIDRDILHIHRDETTLGREQGDWVFTDDPFLSRKHAAISFKKADKSFMLRDLGSANGTSIRIRAEHILRSGDQFRVGRHLFRYDVSGDG